MTDIRSNTETRLTLYTDQTHFQQTSSLPFSVECSLIHCAQYISYVYSVCGQPHTPGKMCGEFTTHRDKQGRQRERQPAVQRAAGRDASTAPITQNLPHRSFTSHNIGLCNVMCVSSCSRRTHKQTLGIPRLGSTFKTEAHPTKSR